MSSVDVKPTSNRKPAGKVETANEPFKQALASCTRALARQPGLEVTFSTDKPSLLTSAEGAKARAKMRRLRRAWGPRGSTLMAFG